MGIKNLDDILVLIARTLEGSADLEEIAQLNNWIRSSPDNKLYYYQLRNIWDASDKQIDPSKINTTAALEKVLGRIPEESSKRTYWNYWQKIAAILILPLAIGSLLWIHVNSSKTISSDEIVHHEINTTYSTRSSLRLTDSTLVWLNAGSRLSYPNKFNNKSRTVFLEGEAYFEVKSNVHSPFIVQTPTLQVKATGTKFNVQDYDSSPEAEVTMVSGKTFVYESGKRNTQLISELNPNQHLAYKKQTKSKSILDTDVYRFIAWKDGKLIFRNEPLSLVLDKISLMFNVDIELQGEELQNYRYHATFQDESLEEILKLLEFSAPINVMEVKREPLPDGSFSKKKLIISKAEQPRTL
jgi:ferric-dicitrate binding protein FerR (iron transport regulator)